MDKIQFPIYKIAICAPVHIQPSDEWIQRLQALASSHKEVSIIITDDSDGKVKLPANWNVFDYGRQAEEMGEDLYNRFVAFHKSSACKNFGHWIAWRDGFDIIMGLDSDCLVPPDFISSHMESLLSVNGGWTNPIAKTGWFSRGYPYYQRKLVTALSLGLWQKELDLYGKDRVDNPTKSTAGDELTNSRDVADGFVPLSGMNWACWADSVPGLLFLPNFQYRHGDPEKGKIFKFTRHDDIWGGYIFQKMMEIRNERIVYGAPIVTHVTDVDPQKDMEDEEAMVLFEKNFYDAVDLVFSQGIEWGMYEDIMHNIASTLGEAWNGSEWEPVATAYKFWSDLFNASNRKI